MKHNAEHAALSLARGDAGTCGIIKNPNGDFEFIGFGMRKPVIELRLSINGEVLTEKTSPFNLIMRRGKSGRKSWAVIADQNWDTLWVSDNTDLPLSCVAIIQPKSDDTGDDPHNIPMVLKARFDTTYSGVIVVCEDFDFHNLCCMEIASMVIPDKNNKTTLERNNSHGTQTDYLEPAGSTTRWTT